MARVSTKYNYRIKKSKAAKAKSVPKLSDSRKEVKIRRKGKTDKVILPREPRVRITKSKAIHKTRRPSSKVKKVNTKQATLKELKDYFRDKKILIVGNSKEVITQSLGEKIDSYDIVVRLNFGMPIKKLAVHMGKKMHIWGHGIKSHKTQMKLYRDVSRTVDYHIETNEKKHCSVISNDKSFTIPRSWYKNEYDRRTGYEMSTGLNMIVFFTKHIKTQSGISIVGFDFLRSKNHILHSTTVKFHNPDAEEEEVTRILRGYDKYFPFSGKYNFAK